MSFTPDNFRAEPAAAAAAAVASVGKRARSIERFLATLIVLIVATPAFQSVSWGPIADAALMTVVLFTGLLAVGGRDRVIGVAAGMLVPAVFGVWVKGLRHDLLAHAFGAASATLFVAFVAQRLLRFVLTSPSVTREVLCAAIAAYLSFGLCWAFAFALDSKLNPNAFVTAGGRPMPEIASDAVYLSFATLSTLGLPDVVPHGGFARMLAITEALGGMFYMTLLIARLVSVSSAAKATPREGNQS